MAELLFLGRVLAGIEQFPARHALLLPADEEWDEHTRCAVLPLSDEDDEAPPFAAEHGLEYALGVYAVQGIVANARLQVPAPSDRMLVDAFLFYFDNDAFIDFGTAS